MDGRGWSDIGYNFLLDQDGNVYEGRGWTTLGAHAHPHNRTHLGVCWIGNSDTVEPTSAAKSSLAELIHEADRKTSRSLALSGHGRLSGQSTACPGSAWLNWLASGLPTEEEDMPLSNEDLERVVNAISGREWDSFTEGEGKTTMVEQIFRARRDAAKALELVETLTRTYPDFVDDGDSTLIQQAFRARRDAHRAAEG